MTITIGYMGPSKLTHGYLAANSFITELKSAGVEAIEEDVVEAVIKKEVSFGLIAVENSYYGIVPESAKILRDRTGSDMRICCEIKIPIHHYLVSTLSESKKDRV